MMQRLKSRNHNFQGKRRENYNDEESEIDESDRNEEQLLLQIDGSGSKPFCMEGTMCGNYFKPIIDTGFPVSNFTKRDLTKIIGERKVVIRDMIDNERYVDYIKRPLELLGYDILRQEVAGVTVSKTRVLVAPNSGKSIIGRAWLIALRYKISQPIERGECKVNTEFVKCAEAENEISPDENISPEDQQIMREFPDLFKRKGRVKITKSKTI